MKTTLTAGLSAKREFTVERESTIGFMGEDARVYATPMLVRDIEITCRELLLEHLDPGEDSVGSRVEIELKGRAVTFDITASDGLDQICRGRHMRFIVSVEQTRQRLKQKQARAA
jgi:predicted thioesterase